MIDQDPIGKLKGTELNQAFSEGVKWLREKVYDPLYPNKLCRFAGGYINMPDCELNIFHVNRFFENGNVERYVIKGDKGLVAFTKESNGEQIQSSILGTLDYNFHDRYFVANIRREERTNFGTHLLKEESEKNPKVKLAMEEMKRAALRVIKICQIKS